jgi:fructose-1-phosphate kinase PfkB-like protein
MGLANDETIKVAVDVLTWILEKINLIIEGISGGNGMTKSLVSLGAAFGVLKTGGTVFDALFATVTKAASKEGLGAGNTFVSAFKGTLKEKSGKLGENFKDLFSWKKLAGSGKLKK